MWRHSIRCNQSSDKTKQTTPTVHTKQKSIRDSSTKSGSQTHNNEHWQKRQHFFLQINTTQNNSITKSFLTVLYVKHIFRLALRMKTNFLPIWGINHCAILWLGEEITGDGGVWHREQSSDSLCGGITKEASVFFAVLRFQAIKHSRSSPGESNFNIPWR
jgi:hypothetical protein